MNNTILVAGVLPSGAGATWSLPSAGFSNPMYITSPTAGSTDATGFDIIGAGTVSISFEGTYTGQAVSHQQTFDPLGVSGWFTVEGVASVGGISSASGSTSGIGYSFPAIGVRHRIQVTALSTGTISARIANDEEVLASMLSTTGVQSFVTAAPTVTASSAYASGNSVGGLLTFSGALRSSGGTGLLQKVVVNMKSTQASQLDLVLFNANPSNTTITDKTAFSLATADFTTVIGVVHVTDFTNLGTPSVGQANALAMSVQAASGTSLFGALITRSTPTFTATTDVSVSIQVIDD